MNDFLWHVDSAFMSLVGSQLLLLGGVFAVLFAAAVFFSARKPGDSNDD